MTDKTTAWQAVPKKTFVTLQVVLEYQWTSSRDLISGVRAQLATDRDDRKKGEEVSGSNGVNEQATHADIKLSSVLESLADKGFELGPDHRVSYRDPIKALNVYIGKASDAALIESYRLPGSAVETSPSDGAKTLTIVLREPGVGLGLGTQQALAAPQNAAAITRMGSRQLTFGSESLCQEAELAESADQGRAHEASALEQQRQAAGSARCTRSSTADQQQQQALLDAADLKRTKERQIRFVVERVSLWRKLYNGVELGNGETVRYSLEDSAKLVGISKKSLDDYLLQLRFGRMYGFDFLKHQCDNIGVLRKFVREHKNKQRLKQTRSGKKAGKGSQDHSEEDDTASKREAGSDERAGAENGDSSMVEDEPSNEEQLVEAH